MRTGEQGAKIVVYVTAKMKKQAQSAANNDVYSLSTYVMLLIEKDTLRRNEARKRRLKRLRISRKSIKTDKRNSKR